MKLTIQPPGLRHELTGPCERQYGHTFFNMWLKNHRSAMCVCMGGWMGGGWVGWVSCLHFRLQYHYQQVNCRNAIKDITRKYEKKHQQTCVNYCVAFDHHCYRNIIKTPTATCSRLYEHCTEGDWNSEVEARQGWKTSRRGGNRANGCATTLKK